MNPITRSPALAGLIQHLTQQLTQLVTQLATDFSTHSTTLADVEQAVVPAIRDLGASLIAGLCGVLTSPTPERTTPCACGQQAAYQRMRCATVTTLLGSIQIPRAYYLCPVCHRGCAPTDATLQIVAGSVSAGLAAVMALLGATQDSFGEAASVLERLTLVHVSPTSIRHTSESLGATLQAQDRAEATRAQDVRTCPAADTAPVPRIPRLYISMDGIQVHFREPGWGELKVGCVYQTRTRPDPQHPDQLQIRLEQPSYCVRRGDPESFAALLWQEAVRRGVLHADEVVVLGDGSAWIWGIAERQFAGATQILDWYHARSYVWEAATAIWVTDVAQRTVWVRAQLTALWERRLDAVLAALEVHREVGEAVVTTITYYTNQRRRMDYATYRARGMQIGSGSIESACKQLVTSRLKGAGMMWDEAGAEAMATVRAYLKSGRWDAAMERRPPRQRTYARTAERAGAACPTAAADATPRPLVPAPSPSTALAQDGAHPRRTRIPPEVHAQVRAELAAERAKHIWKKAWSRRQQVRMAADMAP